MKKSWLWLFCGFLCLVAFADVRNVDKPLNGEWDFRPQKVWQIDDVNGVPFERPSELRASKDEELSYGHQHCPEQHSVPVPEVFVRHLAPEDGGGIDKTGVGPVDQCSFGVTLHQGFYQIKREENAHSIVAETFPHLREEKRHKPLRMCLGDVQVYHSLRFRALHCCQKRFDFHGFPGAPR